jgi:hypothetical protein
MILLSNKQEENTGQKRSDETSQMKPAASNLALQSL